jgi:hypothetical protein
MHEPRCELCLIDGFACLLLVLLLLVLQMTRYACRGLFERHKLLLSLQICAKRQLGEGKIPKEEWEFFLKGECVLPSPQPLPPSTLLAFSSSSSSWCVCAVSPIHPPRQLFADRSGRESGWQSGLPECLFAACNTAPCCGVPTCPASSRRHRPQP